MFEVTYQLPEDDSMRVARLHAETNLWATRFKMAKAAHALAESLVNEVEKYYYSRWWFDEVCERESKWERAVNKIEQKYLTVKTEYENYFTNLKI